MEKIYKLLQTDYVIKDILIENFTVPNKNVDIIITICHNENQDTKISFRNVKTLNVNSESYGNSSKSSIIIEEVSELQWEKINYHISISEDVMTFYCEEIFNSEVV